MADSGDFQLSASLAGHDKDVRAVIFPDPSTVFTASRDCTVQAWDASDSLPPTYTGRLLTQGAHSFNSLAYLPPSDRRPQYPAGLVLAGSYNQTVEVRKTDADISDARVCLLAGHKGNVSTISVSPSGDFVVTGDWDGQVKLWNTATWEVEHELVGPDPSDKQRAIWAVLAYSNTIILTGSADHVIRGYSLQNKTESAGKLQPGVIIRAPDVVRALCRVRKHPSGAQIASAGNDFLIRLWQFNGTQVGVLHGHESFIYALDCLPSGELVSSSEDRTVRIWRGESCVQTITHPALSIWSVSVCQKTGDFATGASDNVARVFTRSPERVAPQAVLEQFSKSVQNSAIPQQQVGDVNPSTLPGPDFIETKSGTKEGQTVMINSGDGNIGVYQWSMGQNQWLLVGTVVDSATGDDSDTAGNNVTGGAGAAPQSTSFGLGSVGGAGAGVDDAAAAASCPIGPHALFATLAQSKFAPVLNRIITVNSAHSGQVPSLSPDHVEQLKTLVQLLEKEVPQIPSAVPAMVPAVPLKTFTLEPASIALVLRLATTWPYKDRLPGLDLLRCMATSPSVAEYTNTEGLSLLDVLLPSVSDYKKDTTTGRPEDVKAVENNTMMVLRLLANLFITTPGQQLVTKSAQQVVDFLSAALEATESKNRNFMIAWASAVSNVTALALREQELRGENAFGVDALAGTIKLLAVPLLDLDDGEVVYRTLVALGNLVSIPGDGDYAERVRSANARTWVNLALGKVGESRVRVIGDKLLQLIEA